MKTLSLAAIVVCLIVIEPASAQESKTEKPRQFIYVLHLVPRLYDDKSWTEQDKAAVGRHFSRLKEAVGSGEVVLAGRTPEPGDKTFGVVIFEAKDEAAAKKFMDEDPAVAAGVMTAELHPFAVALQRQKQ